MKVIWRDKILCENMKVADSLVDRCVGLMFSKKMDGFDGLLIRPCRSIHTFFMRYQIDVLFLSKDLVVTKKIIKMKPWRISSLSWKSTQVLELEGGTIPKELRVGDKIEMTCTN